MSTNIHFLPSGFQFTLADDAMISMTYSRTLAATGELVWFPGAERVQGFTNPLWTLFMAGLHWVGLAGPYASLVVSLTGAGVVLGCGLLAAHIVSRLLEGRGPRRVASAIVGGSVLLLYPLAFWALRGMEVGVLALLTLSLMTLASASLRAWADGGSPSRWLVGMGVVAALGVATRLDFLTVVGVVVVPLIWWAPRKWPVAALAAVPALTSALAVLVFQKAYYGDWLPNTYYLKMEGVALNERLGRGILATGQSLPVLMFAAMGAVLTIRFGTKSLLRRTVAVMASAVAVTAAYSVWVGGDAWENNSVANRYLSVVLPCALMVGVIGTSEWMRAGTYGDRRMFTRFLIAITASNLAQGLLVNPTGYEWVRGAIHALPVVAFVPITLAQAGDYRRDPSRFRAGWLLLSGTLVALAAISAVPLIQFAFLGPDETGTELTRIEQGLALARVTDPDAIVAVLPAGSIAYYADRPMVDMLGKSDRVIAHENSNSDRYGLEIGFSPGHSKFDFSYSLGTLRPDVVVEPWPNAIDAIESYGFVARCTSDGSLLFVQVASQRVHWNQLTICRPDQPGLALPGHVG